MRDENNRGAFPHNADSLSRDYLDRAADAVSMGNDELGMHLYLTAFEHAMETTLTPSEEIVDGLKEAWVIACGLKERLMAEYIFDKLEPYLTAEEVAVCADELHTLAFDKLRDIGLSPEDLKDMAQAISQDFLGNLPDAPWRLGGVMGPYTFGPKPASGLGAVPQGRSDGDGKTPAASADAAEQAHDAAAPTRDAAGQAPSGRDSTERAAILDQSLISGIAFTDKPLTYASVKGYADTVRFMRSIGVGVGDDPSFREFVEMLNVRHGLDSAPALDSLLFRSPAREDANHFMLATAGELEYPPIRMRVEENIQGAPVLCVVSPADCPLHLNASRTAFEGEGTLILEDIDLWIPPTPAEQDESVASLIMAQLMRGARETLDIIHTAVENPKVHVLATASTELEIAPVFLDMLEPFTCVDIDLPTAGERAEIWMDIVSRHPSLRRIDRARLVRCSANMARFDIYLAVRDAIEDAYKTGLARREFVPVSPSLMYEKLAAFHPLDSDEYRELEDAAVGDLRALLDSPEEMEALLSLEDDGA